MLPWDHLSAGLHKDFLWQDWRDALDEVGLEDCRWTPCYDCGACTGYGIEHVVASAVPPAGGSQGTGQGLATGGEVPVTLAARRPAGAGGDEAPVRFTKTGKVRFTSHRDLARIWERAMRRAGLPVAYSRGVLAPPEAALRPGPVHRPRDAREYLDIDLDDDLDPDRRCPRRRHRRSLPVGFDVPQVGDRIAPGTDSLQQAVDQLDGGSRCAASTPPRWRRPSSGCWPHAELTITRRAQGQASPTTSGPPCSTSPSSATDAGTELDAHLATQPRGLRPGDCSRAARPGGKRGRVRRPTNGRR